MVFSSVLFLSVFLPCFLACFYLSPQFLKKWIIVFFSILFYAWGAPVFIFFLLGSSVLDFFISKNFEASNPFRKLSLFASLFLNVGLLCYFKYVNFFVTNISTLGEYFSFNEIAFKEVLLPIGISFFTFQKISYAIDVFRGENKRLTSFLDYLLYIIMFPQLIAGPIVRYKDVHLQIKNFSSNNFDQKLQGLYRFIIGLSKKVFIANTFALIVSQINALGLENTSSAEAWLGALAYTFQIYFDFAGYSDMAIGLGLMIGFKFPENFNFPYLSKSISEFWKRWHITLGSWMRDYLYIPLGGNKVSTKRIYFNLVFVFFISGFWHGANWNFIVWGLFHGLFLVLERLFLSAALKKMPVIFQRFYTFFIVIIGWVFFSMDLETAFVFLKKMFAFSSFDLGLSISVKSWSLMLFGILFSFIGFNKKIELFLNELPFRIANLNTSQTLVIFPVFLFLLSMATIWIMNSGFNPFIYYRF
jgi:alginate O-acetyltransferase complex protein AlgI